MLKKALKAKLSEKNILSVSDFVLFRVYCLIKGKRFLKCSKCMIERWVELLKNVNFELERLKMDDMIKQRKIELLQLRHAQQESEKLSREYELQV